MKVQVKNYVYEPNIEDLKMEKREILQRAIDNNVSLTKQENRRLQEIDKILNSEKMEDKKMVENRDLKNAKNGEDLSQLEIREHHMGYNPASNGANYNEAKIVTIQQKVYDLLHKNAVVLNHVQMQQVQGERKLPIAVNNNEKCAICLENEAFTEKDYGVRFKSMECQKLGQMSVVSAEAMVDSEVSVAHLIADQTAKDYARKLEELLLVGNAENKAEGVLVCADANVVECAGVDYNTLVDAFYSLPKFARSKAVYMTDNAGVKALRKMKDANQRPLLQNGMDSIGQRGQDLLFNCPVVEVEATAMPEGVAGAFVDFDDAVFAGMSRQFSMVRDDSMRRNYDQVCFVSSLRFGCVVVDPKCIAVIKQQ